LVEFGDDSEGRDLWFVEVGITHDDTWFPGVSGREGGEGS
jgi:hypothetical protein